MECDKKDCNSESYTIYYIRSMHCNVKLCPNHYQQLKSLISKFIKE